MSSKVKLNFIVPDISNMLQFWQELRWRRLQIVSSLIRGRQPHRRQCRCRPKKLPICSKSSGFRWKFSRPFNIMSPALSRTEQSMDGCKPTYLTSVRTSAKAVSIVLWGKVKTDVHRENTDVRWVGLHLLQEQTIFFSLLHFQNINKS